MKIQAVAVLAASLALAGCGGGGGGGSSSSGSSDQPQSSRQFTMADLVGTWVRTDKTYDTSVSSSAPDWVSSHHQTIIIEKVSGVYRLRECVSGTTYSADVASNVLTIPSQSGATFSVSDASNISGTLSNADEETQVEMTKVSSSAQVVQAYLDLTVVDVASVPNAKWRQICVDTLQSADGSDTIALKASGSVATQLGSFNGNVFMEFTTAGSFDQPVYLYSGDGIVGSYSLPGIISGNLSDPQGQMSATVSTQTEFSAEVMMYDDQTDSMVQVTSDLRLDLSWLTAE